MLIISMSPFVSSSGANRLEACAILAVAPSMGDSGLIPSVAPLMAVVFWWNLAPQFFVVLLVL